MANMTNSDKLWKLPIDIEASGLVTKTLATQDTYVDKNIQIEINTPDAEFEVKNGGTISATVTNTDTTYTSDTETPYAVTIKADAKTTNATIGLKTPGFAAASDVVDVEGIEAKDSKTIYIKKGHLAGSGESAVAGNVGLTKVGSQPESGFYVKATAEGSVSVDVAGWLPENASADANSEAYYTIKSASLSNNETGDYAEKTAPVLTEDGYLFINEGYIENTKISLATLVPDDANITSENADMVYNTVKAYDSDGKLIIGTMGDAELSKITADDAVANIGTVAVNAVDGVFHVTGSGDISGTASVAVSKRGLAETTLSQEGVIEGEAELDATLAKIGLGVEVADNDVEVTPVIEKEDATTAKSGEITTTVPEGRYVAISTSAIEASTTVTPTVATAGYGTADLHDATGGNVKAGAAASGTYYVPITAAEHTAVAGEATIADASAQVDTSAVPSEGFEGTIEAGILSTAPTGVYITIGADATPTNGSVSGIVTCTSTEGYIEAGQKTVAISGDVKVEVIPAANKYIRVYDGTIL